MKIIVDRREPKHFLATVKNTFPTEATVESEQLQAGDLKIITGTETVLLERKDINDFFASIYDGRYGSQKTKLSEKSDAHLLYIIHGKPDEDVMNRFGPNKSWRMVLGTLSSLSQSGFVVTWLPGTGREGGAMTANFAERYVHKLSD